MLLESITFTILDRFDPNHRDPGAQTALVHYRAGESLALIFEPETGKRSRAHPAPATRGDSTYGVCLH
jgi:hypothetical protein